jgi:negative regulator of sigma E activity
LRAANEEQSRELAARTQALDALRQELAARTQEVETLAAEIQALTARGREQQDSLAALRVHAQAMAGAYRDAVASSQALSAELDAILASRAWRWVTEYRKLRGLIDRRQPRTHRRSSTRSA